MPSLNGAPLVSAMNIVYYQPTNHPAAAHMPSKVEAVDPPGCVELNHMHPAVPLPRKVGWRQLDDIRIIGVQPLGLCSACSPTLSRPPPSSTPHAPHVETPTAATKPLEAPPEGAVQDVADVHALSALKVFSPCVQESVRAHINLCASVRMCVIGKSVLHRFFIAFCKSGSLISNAHAHCMMKQANLKETHLTWSL